jgi:hypothetical protein
MDRDELLALMERAACEGRKVLAADIVADPYLRTDWAQQAKPLLARACLVPIARCARSRDHRRDTEERTGRQRRNRGPRRPAIPLPTHGSQVPPYVVATAHEWLRVSQLDQTRAPPPATFPREHRRFTAIRDSTPRRVQHPHAPAPPPASQPPPASGVFVVRYAATLSSTAPHSALTPRPTWSTIAAIGCARLGRETPAIVGRAGSASIPGGS